MTSALHQRDDDGRPAIRNWQELMKPSRLVAMQPSRLSRSRAIMNKMIRERWDIRIERFDVDADAVGTVVYAIKTPQQEFSLIAFSFAPERQRASQSAVALSRTGDGQCAGLVPLQPFHAGVRRYAERLGRWPPAARFRHQQGRLPDAQYGP